MEQIIITRKNGTAYPLAIKKEATNIKEAKQLWGLLGDDVVNITVESPYPQHYEIGDYFSVFGRTYKLNQLPRVRKGGAHSFTYDLTFEGVQYDLLRAFYDVTIETTGNTLQDVQGDALTGDLKRFATVLVSNANRVFPGKWRLGACPDTIEDKTLTFGDGDNCLAVYQNLCKAFDVEADIIQKDWVYTINFYKRVGTTHPFVFEFGKGKGLYALDRQNVDSSNIVTRLKVFGSDDNITNKYRANRLCLPGKSKSQSFIQQAEAVHKYGIHEARKIFEDIKPTFNGSVTAVVNGNVLQFKDSTMFDLNAKEADGETTKYLVAGVSAKIHFNTGNLAGYEFDIHNYDHTTRTFTLKKLTDDRGDVFPSETSSAFQFAVGDKYKILDVTLPERYQIEAEQKLQEKGNEYYRQNSQPKVKYGLSVSKSYLKSMFGEDVVVSLFSPGDYINIKDDDIGVNKAIRIQSLQRNLLDVYDYTLTISDTAENNITTRVISELIDIDKITTIHNLKDPARAKANWRSSREVMGMVFDPDGDYYTDKIKPNSIDTLALSVGAKSMQFGLINTVFQPNFNGNPYLVKWKGGVLTHYTINEESEVYWVMDDGQITLTGNNGAYYLYAKCEKNGNSGVFIFTTRQIKVEDDVNYYHFLVGTLSSIDPELKARSLALTYGFTMVNGRFIKTGRIESADGTTYFDLDNSEIGGRIVFNSNGSEKTIEELGVETLENKDFINNTLPGLLSEIQAQLDGQIEQFFQTYDPTMSNAPASEWTTLELKENHLGDLFYNTDTGAVFRFVKVNGTYRWQQLSNDEVANALALANEALSLAKDKNRIFTSTPYPPYEVGDLWVQGGTGEIMRCKTTRASGSYTSSDWEKASKYTDDSGLNDFINVDYATDKNDILTQIDGKIETWFQTTDPATAWTTIELKTKHVGDMWYHTENKELKYYTSSYAWKKVEDEKAIEAYEAASQAQDTADGKRRVFVSTPYPPYDIGDLWVNGKDLRRCQTKKAQGQSYNINDWVVAVDYDNTKTVIDGGLVTSGTIQVAGDNKSILAGITGKGIVANSIRFWAGASFENRWTAPFRVQQDGTLYATKAIVKGEVHANKGTFYNGIFNQARITGSIRNAFSKVGDSFDENYNDNIAVISYGGGWIDSYSIPWDVSQSGRRITVVNYKWGQEVSMGVSSFNAPSGKFFFEDGISKKELRQSNELVELLGYGTPQEFYGWIVVRRIDIMTKYSYGKGLKILAQGLVSGWNNGASMSSLRTFDGSSMSVNRIAEGKYKVTFPSKWIHAKENYIVMLTGFGYSYGSNAPLKASLAQRGFGYFIVDTSDDSTRNDGSFFFQITNLNDWAM